jgi:hypothetical protein
MINWLRSLFGWSGSANARTVVGHPEPVDIREAAYIQDSNTRLNILFHLYNRFRGTAHEAKIRSVYDKTKSIHAGLVDRKRIRELELFHLQNTDHFINTFTVILDAHQKHARGTLAALPSRFGATESRAATGNGHQEPGMPLNGRAAPGGQPAAGTQIPRLSAPAVRIHPTARILYDLQEATPEAVKTKEIGLSSTAAEKESFQAHVSARFGIGNITYLGNALVNIPDTKGPAPTGLVAVIQWQGQAYAVNFTDGRLFPVKLAGHT